MEHSTRNEVVEPIAPKKTTESIEPAPKDLGSDDDPGDTTLPSSSKSIWNRARPAPDFAPLSGDLHVDVAVIGGGITGLTAASLLSEAGKRVAILEADRLVSGESGRTTAHLTAVTDERLHALEHTFGREGARAVWASGEAAIQWIESIVQQRELMCGFKRVPGYLYTETGEGAEDLADEHECAVRLGISSHLMLDGLPPYPRMKAAIRFDNQAQFHPREYLLSLAENLTSRGVLIFEKTRALEVKGDPTPRVVTDRGVVHARDVIVATNAPVDNKVFLQTKIAHYRSYAIGVRLNGPAPDGLFWDDSDPYYYVRTHHGHDGDVVIIGGQDHRTGQAEDTVVCFDRLLAWASERFAIASVDYRWSGQIIEPVDGLPYIGHNSFSTHVWEATGYSGNGMTFGTLAGMILTDAILGRPNPWSELYAATRVRPIASAGTYIKENVAFPVHFVMDRLAIHPLQRAQLKPGEGQVFASGTRRIAVYCDEAGSCHAVSAICPHLKCVVDFNRAEQTWDCPCHGSRFDTHGRVLNGPATVGLERIDLARELEPDAPLKRATRSAAEPDESEIERS